MKTYKMNCENINFKKKDHFSAWPFFFQFPESLMKVTLPNGILYIKLRNKATLKSSKYPRGVLKTLFKKPSVASKRLIIISCSTTFNPITPTTLRVMFALCVDTGIKNVALCSPGQAQKLFSCRAPFGVGAQKELYSLCNVAAGCR